MGGGGGGGVLIAPAPVPPLTAPTTSSGKRRGRGKAANSSHTNSIQRQPKVIVPLAPRITPSINNAPVNPRPAAATSQFLAMPLSTSAPSGTNTTAAVLSAGGGNGPKPIALYPGPYLSIFPPHVLQSPMTGQGGRVDNLSNGNVGVPIPSTSTATTTVGTIAIPTSSMNGSTIKGNNINGPGLSSLFPQQQQQQQHGAPIVVLKPFMAPVPKSSLLPVLAPTPAPPPPLLAPSMYNHPFYWRRKP